MEKWGLVDELHRQARRTFPRRSTVMMGIEDTLQADLVEMIPYAKQNKAMKYILTVINIFSKRAYARAIKNKTGEEVTDAMDSILNSLGYSIRNLHVDNGSEFYNKLMQNMLNKRNIKLYSTFTTKKAAIVERFNRTLKNKMWKIFSFRGSYKWVDILPSLLDDYNNTIHRTIKMKPKDVDRGNEEYLLNAFYRDRALPIQRKSKFKVGDYVRISKYKHIFSKGYTPNWTTEVFKINQIQKTVPITYLLHDLDDITINGTVYAEELQLVNNPRLYLVERIIKSKGDKVYVKWLGFDSSKNSWISRRDVLE